MARRPFDSPRWKCLSASPSTRGFSASWAEATKGRNRRKRNVMRMMGAILSNFAAGAGLLPPVNQRHQRGDGPRRNEQFQQRSETFFLDNTTGQTAGEWRAEEVPSRVDQP